MPIETAESSHHKLQAGGRENQLKTESLETSKPTLPPWAGDMTQEVSALVTLTEDLGLILSTYVVVHSHT